MPGRFGIPPSGQRWKGFLCLESGIYPELVQGRSGDRQVPAALRQLPSGGPRGPTVYRRIVITRPGFRGDREDTSLAFFRSTCYIARACSSVAQLAERVAVLSQLPREIVDEKPGEFREAFPPPVRRKVILSQAPSRREGEGAETRASLVPRPPVAGSARHPRPYPGRVKR